MTYAVVASSREPLAHLAQARELLEASRDLAEVKSIRDVALAAQEYARAKKLGAEAERYAAEIAVRAERRIGQLLAETPKDRGGRPKTGADAEPVSPHKQAGKKLSARSQKLAQISDEEFERQVADQRAKISADRLARQQKAAERLAERQRRAAERDRLPAPERAENGLRLAYADPPYLGQGKLYPQHPEAREWDDPETHRYLIERLQGEFPDGWALSASSPSLQILLPMCPSDVRVAAWVKPFAAFKANVRIAYTWEPVIWRGGRLSSLDGAPVGRDHLSKEITLERGLTGAKPEDFCRWVLILLGFDPARDVVADLFPGTGVMADVLTELRSA